MCLTPKSNAPAIEATEDMRVYKVITHKNLSLYQNFAYKPNTEYRIDKPLVVEKGEINEGFHAYISADPINERPSLEDKLVKFFIPKGAYYVLGKYNDVVSTGIRSGDLKQIYSPPPPTTFSEVIMRMTEPEAWEETKKQALDSHAENLMRVVALGMNMFEHLTSEAIQRMRMVCEWQRDYYPHHWRATDIILNKIKEQETTNEIASI